MKCRKVICKEFPRVDLEIKLVFEQFFTRNVYVWNFKEDAMKILNYFIVQMDEIKDDCWRCQKLPKKLANLLIYTWISVLDTYFEQRDFVEW